MKETGKVTIKDVAAKAGVSIATVSRVVHGLPVNPATRAKVEVVIAAMRYAPNLAARALKTNSSQTIACSTRAMLRAPMAPLLASIEKTARDAGYTLVLTAAEETIEGQRETLRLLSSRGLDGLIFSGAAQHDPALIQALENLHIPVVFLDREPVKDIDAVTVAHAHSLEASVKHLHTLGHSKIGLLTVPGNLLPGSERINGYKRGLRACGLKLRNEWLSDKCVDERTSFQQASFMLSAADRPTALIAGGMSILPNVLMAARQLRIQVGRDLSVVAGCDSELAELGSPGITATRWDMAEWGRVATEMLIERIRAPETRGGRRVVIPTELLVRGSTMAPNDRNKI